jgi:hypothetical protein
MTCHPEVGILCRPKDLCTSAARTPSKNAQMLRFAQHDNLILDRKSTLPGDICNVAGRDLKEGVHKRECISGGAAPFGFSRGCD